MARTAQRARRNRTQRNRTRRRSGWTAVCLLAVLAAAAALLLTRGGKSPVREEVALEAGEPLRVELFLAEPAEDAALATSLAEIDTSVPGSYPVEIRVGGKSYVSQLTIRDTVAPTAEAAPVTVRRGEMPAAADCVRNVRDVTPVTVRFQTEPDVETGGEHTAVVELTDASGNTATVRVPVTVIADDEPPVIAGVHDIEAYVGDTISYREGVTVTDNMDEHPVLEIDNSQVDLTAPGVYTVVYRASDSYGNTAQASITLTLVEKPAGYVEPEVVYEMARKILADITDESMDDMQVAYAIYRWVKFTISYTGTSDKSSWTIGAYQAFEARTGDCFNYFAAAKALLDAAGIENMDIVKSDTTHSSHYWNLVNLGDGWYHFDCTPRRGDGDDFFLVTDAELEAYSAAHGNSHVFDPSLYPERATESVQDQVDYNAAVLVRP